MTPLQAPLSSHIPRASGTPADSSIREGEASLLERFRSVREQSLSLCSPLSAEDMMVQSCPESSPAKWHLAHTTWFFETFILAEFLPNYKPFHPDFHWLFNSYYNSLSVQPEKKLRASFSRPGADAILAYRRHVEEAMQELCTRRFPSESASPAGFAATDEAERRIVLGLHHEQQHQELLCYDIKNAFWSNPLHPAYAEGLEKLMAPTPRQPLSFLPYEGGLVDVGYQEGGQQGDGFSFDNEGPQHAEYLRPFQLGSRLITCGEYLEFMEDGGYERAELWLSEGWETVKAQGWQAPLYWHREGAGGRDEVGAGNAAGPWQQFTMRGNASIAALAETPVCHVSYFEADAYAHWAGKRLPTEVEWEIAADAGAGLPYALGCNFLENDALHPLAASGHAGGSAPQQLLGDVWEWTRSAYLGYPGYKPVSGALGEYNGKFMMNQMVLRGGSAVTPVTHIRNTYRNFFAPSARWQFSGIRLANDERTGQ